MKILLISLLFLIGCKKDIYERHFAGADCPDKENKHCGIVCIYPGEGHADSGTLWLRKTADYGQSWPEDSIIFIGSYAGDMFRWTSDDGITWTEETNTFFTDKTKSKP